MKIANGWVDTAIGIYYPNKSMSRNGLKPTHICLHSTAGGTSAQSIANYFLISTAQASSHIIIGVDGTIVQGLSMDVAAWGNGILDHPRLPWPTNINPNSYTISIEHCKPSIDNSDTLTPAQQQSSFRLIAAICDAYGIAKRAGDVHSGIVSHADFDSVSRARCPGIYPWNDLFTYLKGATVKVPDKWSDDGTTLTAPNGHKVGGGFRAYILNPDNDWNPSDQPREEEHSASPVEISNPGLGAGNIQSFNYSRLTWTPSKGVFLTYIGYEAMILRQKLKV